MEIGIICVAYCVAVFTSFYIFGREADINEEERTRIDPTLNQLIEFPSRVPRDQIDGVLDYMITKILKSLY